MIQNVLQCCYTNAITETGNVVSSGWKAVCVSPDLPSDAFSFCTRIQNANSSILNAMRDESGAVLNLLEICGDGTYICMIRTQYGLMDRLGRENMFSHAYIFPCRDKNTIRDPNAFLTIDNSNFKYSEEAANELAPAFARLPAFRIESALEACGLSKETYLKLIQCVYAQMSDKKSTRPLYIQYDGSETTLRALLYCIYYGLPFAFRKKLSVSSVKTDNTTGKNLIFSVKAREQDLFIDPKTGDNSVLTARMERRLSRLGFLSYAVRNIAHPNILNYFEALEAKALELGDSTGQNELFLKIAHILLISKDVRDVEDSELDTRLSDALRVNSIGNRTMDEYIAKLLSEITARKLVLTEENEAALNERIDAAGSGLLKDAVEQYNFYRFNELSAAEAASRLSAMSPAVFAEYRGKLRKTENGARILDYYYAEIKSKSCADSWKAIAQLYAETNDLPSRPLTGDKVDTLAWNLYERGLEKVREGDVSGAVQEYKYYMTIMQARFGARNAAGSGIAAKEAFWDQVSYDNIVFAMYNSYKSMEIDTPACRKLLICCSLPSILLSGDDESFFREANRFYLDTRDELGSKAETILRTIIEEAKMRKTEMDDHFELWCKTIIPAENRESLDMLIELYNAAEQGDTEELLNAFNRMAEQYSGEQVLPREVRTAARIVLSICEERDSEESAIPLDAWLSIGSCLYSNSFTIFDETEPFVLAQDETELVSGSSLIKKARYIKDAEAYVQTRGREYKTVKRWLSAVQHMRRSAAEAASGAAESGRGRLGWGNSPFARPPREETYEAPVQTSAPQFEEPDSSEGTVYVPREMRTPEEIENAASGKTEPTGKKGIFGWLRKKDK